MKKIIFLIISIVFAINLQNANAQSIDLKFPKGGEHWINKTHSPHNIIWESNGVDSVNIEYSTDNGNSWQAVAHVLASQKFYTWKVPDISSTQMLIKLSGVKNPSITSQSPDTFTVSANNIYYARWHTSMGNFTAKLHGDKVPVTVQNFINLIERKFYYDLIFHRVFAKFMIQDGCPIGDGTGSPGYEFEDEFNKDLLHNQPGILSMANAGANTNGSQYFITVKPTPWLNNKHSIFGKIVDGMDTVLNISEVPTTDVGKPLSPVKIDSIKLVKYEPKIELKYPTDNSVVIAGSDTKITWESEFIETVKIEFSADGGNTKTVLAEKIPAWQKSFDWQVPETISTDCKIYITEVENPTNTCTNAQPFKLEALPMVVTKLNLFENVTPPAENPENLIYKGSKIRFKILLKNTVSQNMEDVSVSLTSNLEGLEVSPKKLSFGSMSGNSEAWSNDFFEVTLPETVLSKSDFTLMFDAKTGNSENPAWITKFVIPIVIRNNAKIDDDNNGSSNGNGNKKLDYGETVELKLKVFNKASTNLYEVYGRLTSPNDFINIWNNVQGEDGTVYDSLVYNDNKPFSSGNYVVQHNGNFVMDYSENSSPKTDLDLELYGYLKNTKANGGTKIGYKINYKITNNHPTNIAETSGKNNVIEIYPNPAKQEATIDIKIHSNTNVVVKITNINGKFINSYNVSSPNKLKINTANLKQGVYFVSTIIDEYLYTKKLIIIH